MHHEQPISGEPSPASPQPADAPAAAPAEQHEAEPSVQPRIWVASLADYNHGIRYGTWIDAARGEAELQADIDAMLDSSPWTARTGAPVEEWVVHDYDGFGPLRIDEHENLGWISRVANGIAEHGLAFAAWAGVVEHVERLEEFDQVFLGHYDDLHAYIEQLINDLGYDRILEENLPATVRPYVKINLTATAQDLLRDLHAVPAPDGGVWIFRG